MANLAIDIEAQAGDEPILAAVIGEPPEFYGRDAEKPVYVGKILPWSEARGVLDYEYCDDCGGDQCHPVYAWTEHQIIFVHEYDGSRRVVALPRNPTECEPWFNNFIDLGAFK